MQYGSAALENAELHGLPACQVCRRPNRHVVMLHDESIETVSAIQKRCVRLVLFHEAQQRNGYADLRLSHFPVELLLVQV